MAQRPLKSVRESYTEQIQILMSAHINGQKRLFGGVLMEWIDVVAAVAARRHAGHEVTTACVDHLQFLSNAHINETMVLTGRVTYVGNTSMEVRVDTFVEAYSGQRRLVNRAYLVMVALDENEKPVSVPGLRLETEEEKREWEAGLERQAQRKSRRSADA